MVQGASAVWLAGGGVVGTFVLGEGCRFSGRKSCSMLVMATSVDVVFLLEGITEEIFRPTTMILFLRVKT